MKNINKILNLLTFENFMKYVLFQFVGGHVFYSALYGEGPINEFRSWIPFIVMVLIVSCVAVSEFIRNRK